MKLLKYFLFIGILIVSALFIDKLDDSNKITDIIHEKKDGVVLLDSLNKEPVPKIGLDPSSPVMVQIPFIVGEDSKSIFSLEEDIEIKYVVIGSLSLGVAVGFLMALFQIISQKSNIIKQRSKLKKLQIELDNLRNQAIDDNIEIVDELDEIDMLDELDSLDKSDDEFDIK